MLRRLVRRATRRTPTGRQDARSWLRNRWRRGAGSTAGPRVRCPLTAR